MNREERRARERELRGVEGFSSFRRLVMATMKRNAEPDMLRDGDKVKLKTDQIMGRKGFSRMIPAYQEFVRSNDFRVFTAKIRRAGKGGYPVVVDLVEDNTWSFWSGDLIKITDVNDERRN